MKITVPGDATDPEQRTSLEPYILKSETKMNLGPGKMYKRNAVFAKGPNGEAPFLTKGEDNQILVYTGCFNPPHRGHRELLMHAFLSTDNKTVAAIIIPTSEGSCRQKKDGEFVLTQKQRTKLLRDPFLDRMSWVFPGEWDLKKKFFRTLKKYAKADGFDISFVALKGSDWGSRNGYQGWEYGDGSMITSDFTRPACCLDAGSYGRPIQLPGLGRWEEERPQPEKARDIEAPSFCWRDKQWCWAFRSVFPEVAGVVSLQELEQILSFDSSLYHLLLHCHLSPGHTWRCTNYDKDGHWLRLIPSGRRYPTDDRFCSASSTAIRRNLNAYMKSPKDNDSLAMHLNLKSTVRAMNVGLLMHFAGIYDSWPFAPGVEPSNCSLNGLEEEWRLTYISDTELQELVLGSKRDLYMAVTNPQVQGKYLKIFDHQNRTLHSVLVKLLESRIQRYEETKHMEEDEHPKKNECLENVPCGQDSNPTPAVNQSLVTDRLALYKMFDYLVAGIELQEPS
ncbi:hypothetical protein BU24DRAFT_483890 [Aaosphaeria arxii CBS 175.79]|uniref:Cytidyltransferase-like domain-containing protein n=1 Tax=Aaosphaeria arxii CBS 175.79 TaxID=1450172 RepID=A0A6A5XMN9_9PLEO|nr:uncharacterized protein BU24DRAFT_483890 [Aaosphaeria arxii CBS 175.79]KAF2014010.1 hypothetical protein BU24DRAFT_483890 [Aaosphaeria arxii CBS 175.79]